MDEAKSLFHISISAMFAALLLGAITVIVSISYLMWTYFSKQDAASAKMMQYSNLTAFDNTTLRGSEVESLLTAADDMGIYVVFYDSTGSSNSLNDQTSVSNIRFFYADPNTSAYNIISHDLTNLNTIKTCQVAIDKTIATIGRGADNYPASRLSGVPNLHSYTHRDLVSVLTNSGQLGNPNANGTYGVFKAALIYSGDATSDVVGIALVRAASNVTNYCLE